MSFGDLNSDSHGSQHFTTWAVFKPQLFTYKLFSVYWCLLSINLFGYNLPWADARIQLNNCCPETQRNLLSQSMAWLFPPIWSKALGSMPNSNQVPTLKVPLKILSSNVQEHIFDLLRLWGSAKIFSKQSAQCHCIGRFCWWCLWGLTSTFKCHMMKTKVIEHEAWKSY